MAVKEKIQEVPEGWEKTKLGLLADYINGYAFKPADWKKDGYPIIRIEQLKNSKANYDYSDKKIPTYNIIGDGDLIFSWSASLSLVIWNRGKAYLNQHLYKVIEKNGINKQFLKFLIESKLERLIAASHGSTMQHITRPSLLNFKVIIPNSETEQRTIASIPSTCDEAIEKTDAKIEKLKRIKQGLMQDLFRVGIDENGKMRSETTHRFKDSPLGRIPVEWEVKTLDYVCEKIADRDHTTPKYIENGVPIVSPQDFDKNEKINFNNCAMISLKDHLINRKKTDIEVDDIVFTRIGAGLGKSCLVTKEMPEFSILHSAAMIRANKSRILPMYLLYSLKSFNLQKQIVDGIQSIGVPDLGLDKMKQLRLVMPINLNEQSRIASVLSSADEAIEKEEAYKNKLLVIKRGLMDDLLSGKVRVNKLMKEAA